MLQILLVEDERIVAMAMRSELAQLGYKVVALAANGADALKALTTHAIDIVLMDVMIEGPLDGIETARQIAAKSKVPIIYLTGESDEKTFKRAFHSDSIAGFMLKPVHPALLVEKLNAITLQKNNKETAVLHKN